MSRVRFAVYFFSLSACATAAFASTMTGFAAPAGPAVFAAEMSSPIPRSPAFPKRGPHRGVPAVTQIAFANTD